MLVKHAETAQSMVFQLKICSLFKMAMWWKLVSGICVAGKVKLELNWWIHPALEW